MTPHRLLLRQLRRHCGVDSPQELAAQWATADGERGEALRRSMVLLLQQVSEAYALYDRDIALAGRSLQISSEELLAANAVQERALGHLRQALRQLAANAGLPPPTGDDSGLESLSHRLASLIAAQEEAQRALQASEAKFRDLTELSSDWYWEQDHELRFVATVGRDDDRGGLTPEQHVGLRRWELPHTEALDISWAEHEACLRAQRRFDNLLLRRRAADGSLSYVEVSGAPVFDAQGRFTGYRGIARNVSARVQAQSALEEAKAAADAANAAKSRFLANMSHEIRTPMNGMLGMAELLLLDPGLSAQQRERAELILSTGRNLVAIINDILDLSKIEAGRLQIEDEPFELRPLVEQLSALFATVARSKDLALEVEIDPALPAALRGDVLRIKQVLGNLLSNALKFTERGRVRLRLRRVDDDAQCPRWRIELDDSGPGVSPALADQLFKAFVQADASTTRRFGGTGLGLAISRQLVRAMHGEIGVHASALGGACFWAELPLTEAPTPPRVACTAAAAAPQAWPGRLVLLVEDNAVNRQIALAHLARHGIAVETAEHGIAALAALRRRRFDLVLMDCQMPVLDGYDAVSRWREHESRHGLPRTPVIAVTANAMDVDRQRSRAAGFDDHLGKPFSGDELRHLLGRWLRQV